MSRRKRGNSTRRFRPHLHMECAATNVSMAVYLSPNLATPASWSYSHKAWNASKNASRSASVSVRTSRFTYLQTSKVVYVATIVFVSSTALMVMGYSPVDVSLIVCTCGWWVGGEPCRGEGSGG